MPGIARLVTRLTLTALAAALAACSAEPGFLLFSGPGTILFTDESAAGQAGVQNIQSQNIYSVKEDGTGFKRLTATADYNYPCGVSSKKEIVFTKYPAYPLSLGGSGAGRLFTMHEDGANVKALPSSGGDESCYAVIQDRIVFTRTTYPPAGAPTPPNIDILAMPADGSQAPIALAATPAQERPVAITPDGRVVFTRWDDPGHGFGRGFSLNSVYPDGTWLANLEIPAVDPQFVGVSSNSRVVYLAGPQPQSLYAVSGDGSNHTLLANPKTIEDRVGNPHIVFCGVTGDGRVLFTLRYTAGGPGLPQQLGDAYVANADGTNLRRVRVSVDHHNDTCSGVTPGNWAILTRQPDMGSPQPGIGALVAVSIDGNGQDVVLAPGQSLDLEKIVPDGTVVFGSYDPASQAFVMSGIRPADAASGSAPTRLAQNAYASGVTLSRVIFYQPAGGAPGQNLFTVNRSGDGAHHLDPSPSNQIFRLIYY